MPECRGCGAEIIFKPTANGRGMPLDAETNAKGNVALATVPGAGPIAVVLSGETLDKARKAGTTLWVSHFAVCPEAERFKGKGRGSR